MRTAALALAFWGGAALGAAIGTKTIEVEGEEMKLDAKEFSAKPPGEVAYKLYTATRGPDKVLVAVGQVKSNLPHEWFRIKVRITVWLSYKDQVFPLGCFNEAGCVEWETTRLKPGTTARFAAFVRGPTGVLALNLGHTFMSAAAASAEKISKDDK